MTIYTQSARFDERQHFLTEDEMRKAAPSIFAVAAHSSRSDRFKPIATIDVVRMLENEGFGVVGARQAVARMDDRKDFTKHLLRLRRKDGLQRKVGDTVFEVLLKNANDGTACYDLFAGLWRIRCLNSLVALSIESVSHRVRHSGNDVAPKVIDGVFEVVKEADRALEAPAKWGQLLLPPPEQMAFATSAHAVRFPVKEDGSVTTNVTPKQLLTARRSGDTENDLWTVFNRVQENAIKGGLTAQGVNANGQRRLSTTRQIKGIDQSVALNRALWTLAEKMAEIKAA